MNELEYIIMVTMDILVEDFTRCLELCVGSKRKGVLSWHASCDAVIRQRLLRSARMWQGQGGSLWSVSVAATPNHVEYPQVLACKV